jgi:hypothetical protein
MSAAGFETQIRAIMAAIPVLQGCGSRTGLLDETPVTEDNGRSSSAANSASSSE